jgi:hypothetical protein
MSSVTTESRISDDLRKLLENPPFGAEDVTPGGYGTEGDALGNPRVTQTVDQIDLNVIWAELAAVTAEFNAHKTAVVNLLSYYRFLTP